MRTLQVTLLTEVYGSATEIQVGCIENGVVGFLQALFRHKSSQYSRN